MTRRPIPLAALVVGLAAFCDTFGRPIGSGNRSGQLDGIVWGVSRATSDNNPPCPST